MFHPLNSLALVYFKMFHCLIGLYGKFCLILKFCFLLYSVENKQTRRQLKKKRHHKLESLEAYKNNALFISNDI